MTQDINKVWKKYEDNNISHSATHYLFTIHHLLEENGYARMIDISKKLKITPWSCSTGIKSLLKKDLVMEDSNKFIKLTQKGSKIISEILNNREVLYNFFKDILWTDASISLINACKIEHLIDTEIISKMKKFKS